MSESYKDFHSCSTKKNMKNKKLLHDRRGDAIIAICVDDDGDARGCDTYNNFKKYFNFYGIFGLKLFNKNFHPLPLSTPHNKKPQRSNQFFFSLSTFIFVFSFTLRRQQEEKN